MTREQTFLRAADLADQAASLIRDIEPQVGLYIREAFNDLNAAADALRDAARKVPIR